MMDSLWPPPMSPTISRIPHLEDFIESRDIEGEKKKILVGRNRGSTRTKMNLSREIE